MPWTGWWPQTSGGYSVVKQSRADDDPADISERFMRRMIGDERWERLPPATETAAVPKERRSSVRSSTWRRRAIRARGDHGSRRHCAWTTGADHHRRSTEELFSTLPDPTMVTISEAGHGAHTTHPDEFRRSSGSWSLLPVDEGAAGVGCCRRQRDLHAEEGAVAVLRARAQLFALVVESRTRHRRAVRRGSAS